MKIPALIRRLLGIKPADPALSMLMAQSTHRLQWIHRLQAQYAEGLAAWKANNKFHADRIAELEAELEMRRDMLDDARFDLEAIRSLLGVPVEPHQNLRERLLVAAGDCAKAQMAAAIPVAEPGAKEQNEGPASAGAEHAEP